MTELRARPRGPAEIELWVSGPPHVVVDLLDDQLREDGAATHDGWFELRIGDTRHGIELQATGRIEPAEGGVRLFATLDEAPAARWVLWGATAIVVAWGVGTAVGGSYGALPVALLGVGFLWGVHAVWKPQQLAIGAERLRRIVRRAQDLADYHAQIGG